MLRSQSQKHVTRAASQLQINEYNVRNVHVGTNVPDTVNCVYPLSYSVIYSYIKVFINWDTEISWRGGGGGGGILQGGHFEHAPGDVVHLKLSSQHNRFLLYGL